MMVYYWLLVKYELWFFLIHLFFDKEEYSIVNNYKDCDDI